MGKVIHTEYFDDDPDVELPDLDYGLMFEETAIQPLREAMSDGMDLNDVCEDIDKFDWRKG